MPTYISLLDESGDLGWIFDKPFRQGGSSRFLTIAYLVLPAGSDKLPKRIVRKVYKHFKFDFKNEVKGSMLDDAQLDYVAHKIREHLKSNPDHRAGSITVKKGNVQEHIRVDGNLLYNYMIRLSLVPRIEHLEKLYLIRDNRSIKVKSGNSLRDYLKMILWFDCGSMCELHDCPEESHLNHNLIFIDWMAHIIWSKYENQEGKHCGIIAPHMVEEKTLFF